MLLIFLFVMISYDGFFDKKIKLQYFFHYLLALCLKKINWNLLKMYINQTLNPTEKIGRKVFQKLRQILNQIQCMISIDKTEYFELCFVVFLWLKVMAVGTLFVALHVQYMFLICVNYLLCSGCVCVCETH